MQNDKEKFKKEFKTRIYGYILNIIRLIDSLPKENVSRRIGDQLLRSSTSIIANYIEAQASSSKKDFTNFFVISLKSANETKLWLALLRDSARFDKKRINILLEETKSIANILASSILTLKGKK